MSAKIALLDIECSPITVHAWSLRDLNVGLSQIRQHPRVIGVASKWYGAKGVAWRSEYHQSRTEMLEHTHALLDAADIAVHYNGAGFDIPWLMGEFAREDMPPPSPFKNIDLYRVARKAFRFPSYKLQYVSTALGLEGKLSTGGHDLWVRCLESEGEEQRKAWALMRRYAKQDTALLEPLFDKLRPYFPASVNLAAYAPDAMRCPSCAGTSLQARGEQVTSTRRYQRYHCQTCGRWSRGVKSEGSVVTT